METTACVINVNIPMHGCLTQTDALIILAAIALGLFIVFGIPMLIESRKSDKIADRLERERKRKKDMYK